MGRFLTFSTSCRDHPGDHQSVKCGRDWPSPALKVHHGRLSGRWHSGVASCSVSPLNPVSFVHLLPVVHHVPSPTFEPCDVCSKQTSLKSVPETHGLTPAGSPPEGPWLTLLLLFQPFIRCSLQCRDLVDEAKKFHLRPELRTQMQGPRTRARLGKLAARVRCVS